MLKVDWGNETQQNSNLNREAILSNNLPKTDLANYIVELPSNGLFYPGNKNTVQISALTIGQVRQIEAASKIQDKSNYERELANIIGKSIHDFNVFDLTVDDYQFLLYWIRLNSYRKVPYSIRWTYKNELDEEQEVTSIIKITDFNINSCEKHAKPEYGYKTVRDQIDILALPTEEDMKYAEFACVLPGKDLAEKIAKLDQMPLDKLHEVRYHIQQFNHGITETVKVKGLEVDGSPEFKIELSLDLSDFFP